MVSTASADRESGSLGHTQTNAQLRGTSDSLPPHWPTSHDSGCYAQSNRKMHCVMGHSTHNQRNPPSPSTERLQWGSADVKAIVESSPSTQRAASSSAVTHSWWFPSRASHSSESHANDVTTMTSEPHATSQFTHRQILGDQIWT